MMTRLYQLSVSDKGQNIAVWERIYGDPETARSHTLGIARREFPNAGALEVSITGWREIPAMREIDIVTCQTCGAYHDSVRDLCHCGGNLG